MCDDCIKNDVCRYKHDVTQKINDLEKRCEIDREFPLTMKFDCRKKSKKPCVSITNYPNLNEAVTLPYLQATPTSDSQVTYKTDSPEKSNKLTVSGSLGSLIDDYNESLHKHWNNNEPNPCGICEDDLK